MKDRLPIKAVGLLINNDSVLLRLMVWCRVEAEV